MAGQQSITILQARKKLFDAMRVYFDTHGYLEVHTPLWIPAPALEDYIDAIPAGKQYLRTSPELHMKRLLGGGLNRIYQLGACFRAGEYSSRHLPEFTMLEWYRADADCYGILHETIELVRHCCKAITGQNFIAYEDQQIELHEDWDVMTVDEAFARYAETERSVDALIDEQEFEIKLLEDVQPNLGKHRPTVLSNFPAGMSSLARKCPENPDRVERWELFIAGMEIANAYTELTDYTEQIQRFEVSRDLRAKTGREIYPLDKEYLKLLKKRQLPECGGIAFGVDRFLMLLTNQSNIQDVVPFADERMTG